MGRDESNCLIVLKFGRMRDGFTEKDKILRVTDRLDVQRLQQVTVVLKVRSYSGLK